MADIPVSNVGYSSYHVLLMHMNGADDGTTFTDEIGHTVNRFNAVTKTGTKQLGSASAYFDGTGDYLTVDHSADWDFGSGDFTISFFVKSTTTTGMGVVLHQGNWGGYSPFVILRNTTNYELYSSSNGSSWDVASAKVLGTVSTSAFQHIVISRTGNTFHGYINGVEGSGFPFTSSATLYNSATALAIGSGADGSGGFYAGYFDEISIWKGLYYAIGSLYPQTTEYGQTGTINSVTAVTCALTVQPVRIGCTSSSVTTVTPTPSVQGGIYGSVTIYPTPSLLSNFVIDDIETLIIGATVDRELNSKMYTANFEFDKDTISSIPDHYFTHVVFSIPDYTNTSRVVFYGFFPTSVSKYTNSNAKDMFTAVDYGFYLTKQYLPDTLLALYTPDFQATYQKYRLNYDYCLDPLLNFNVGDRVVGGTTGDSAKVFENHFSGFLGQGYLILCDAVGSTNLVEPFFEDDEDLNVNDVTIAAADGYTMNVTGTPEIVRPDMWVRDVLGGDNWAKITGIEPYRINVVTAWDTAALPAVEFDFQTTQTKMSAIEELAEYCSFIFMVKWRDIGTGEYRPCAYFVDETLLDHATLGLDLPAAATFNYNTDTTVTGITLDNRGEEKYNKVTVRCMDMDGIWYESVVQSDGVALGNEIPIEFYEENKNLASQDDADTRAQDIYDYYSSNVKTWTVTLRARSDLQLLQKLTVSNYGTNYQLPDGDYRIVSISYEYSHTINKTIIRIVADADFTAHLKLNRVFTGPIATMQAVAKDMLNKEGQIDVGTVTAIDGNTISVMTERGITKIARDAS